MFGLVPSVSNRKQSSPPTCCAARAQIKSPGQASVHTIPYFPTLHIWPQSGLQRADPSQALFLQRCDELGLLQSHYRLSSFDLTVPLWLRLRGESEN